MGEAGSESPCHREPCTLSEPASAGREKIACPVPIHPTTQGGQLWGGWAPARLQPIPSQVQVLQTHHHPPAVLNQYCTILSVMCFFFYNTPHPLSFPGVGGGGGGPSLGDPNLIGGNCVVLQGRVYCEALPLVSNRGCVMFGMSPPAHNNILLGTATDCCLF